MPPKKTATYSGVVTTARVRVLKGARYRTRLPPGYSYADYSRRSVMVAFKGDDGQDYWFHSPEVNVDLRTGEMEKSSWLIGKDKSTIHPGDRIVVTAKLKRQTKHGIQLYYARLKLTPNFNSSSDSNPVAAAPKPPRPPENPGLLDQRITLLEKKVLSLESTLSTLGAWLKPGS